MSQITRERLLALASALSPSSQISREDRIWRSGILAGYALRLHEERAELLDALRLQVRWLRQLQLDGRLPASVLEIALNHAERTIARAEAP